MKSKMLLAGGVLVLLLLAGGLAAYSLTSKMSQFTGEKVAEKMIENATGGKADVNIDSNKVTIKTNEGTFSAGVDLPKDWPNDIPVYPESVVTYSGSNAPTDGKTGFSVMLTTQDTIRQVSDYYTKQLKDQGWAIESAQTIASTAVISAVKNNRDLTVTTNSSGEETLITLVTAAN